MVEDDVLVEDVEVLVKGEVVVDEVVVIDAVEDEVVVVDVGRHRD